MFNPWRRVGPFCDACWGLGWSQLPTVSAVTTEPPPPRADEEDVLTTEEETSASALEDFEEVWDEEPIELQDAESEES